MNVVKKIVCNSVAVSPVSPTGTVVLDFLRNECGLLGTKSACREGECGSCAVLMGTLDRSAGCVKYKTVASCLLPLGDVVGKHLVSIEGINSETDITPIQELFITEGATQCGYCTPGFIMSLTGFLLSSPVIDSESGVEAVAGNICRCTGYGSIKRVIGKLADRFVSLPPPGRERIDFLIEQNIVPGYFSGIPSMLEEIGPEESGPPDIGGKPLVAGGTDIYVQQPEKLAEADIDTVGRFSGTKRIEFQQGRCTIGAGVDTEALKENSELKKRFPLFSGHMKKIASVLIRNQATVGGNIANASPIADLTVIFIALGADIHLVRSLDDAGFRDGRTMALRDFFLDYKKLALEEGEIISGVEFDLPRADILFHFEKVSRREHLDIASVNSAVRLDVDRTGGAVSIRSASIAAGGVAPVPFFLSRTSAFLTGRRVEASTVIEAASIADSEVKPISDVRGSAKYKRLLLRQLMFSHFITLFPGNIEPEALFVRSPGKGGAL